MARKLPPLNALRAFEVTARHGSFSRAASELGVTQGAVSKQIHILEDHLGVRLFERRGRQIFLKPEAERYFPFVASAFDALALATEELSQHTRTEQLTVSILPSLTSRWFIPLLEDFRRQCPAIAVRTLIGDGPIDFATSEADIAIRAEPRNRWKHLHAEVLMGEELVPVASPALLRAQPVNKPTDLLRFTLLQHTCRPNMWRDYLRGVGVKNPAIKHDLGFEHFFMSAQAAVDGLGVALIPRFLIERELQEKSLQIACTAPYQSPYKYYLLCPKHALSLKKIRQFRQWLLRMAAQ